MRSASPTEEPPNFWTTRAPSRATGPKSSRSRQPVPLPDRMGTEKRARQKANRQARLQAAVAAQQREKKKRQYLRIGVIALIVVAVLATFALWPRSGDDSTAGGFAYGTGPCPPDQVSAP